jgi:hypothetical protein
MRTTDTARFTKHEAMQVLWAQILKTQWPALEMLREKSARHSEIANDRRAGQTPFRDQESLIVSCELPQSGSVCVWPSQRNGAEAAQKFQQLSASRYIAPPSCVGTVRVKLVDPLLVKSCQRRNTATFEPGTQVGDQCTFGSYGLRGVTLASEERRKPLNVRREWPGADALGGCRSSILPNNRHRSSP